jgi:histidyl-tRNA synthetase
MKLQNARGTRDYGPEDAILLNEIVGVLRTLFETYGFNPLETPSLERRETLTSKYAGGAEILKELFTLADHGKRELALRYDLTVPLARYVVMNPTLKFPFKRYQIGTVFRDGPLKFGRYREFMQCDADIVGSGSLRRDAELVEIAAKAFEQLGLKVSIKINNRKVLDGIMDAVGIAADKAETVILTIDKLEKIGEDAVKKELEGKGVSVKAVKQLMSVIIAKGTNKEKLTQLQSVVVGSEGKDGLKEIAELLSYTTGLPVEFDVSLARGLNYYTGSVFEVVLKNSELRSSVAAGGRYDELIGSYVRNGKEYDAVGISFGLDVITDALKLGRRNLRRSSLVAYVISINQDKEAHAVVKTLRNASIPSDVTYSGKIGKAVNYANEYGIPYVLFIGPEEAKAGKVKVRNMSTGQEQMVGVEDACKIIKVA